MWNLRVDWVLLLSIASLAQLSHSLSITYPTNRTDWARGEVLRVDWTSSSADPRIISITLIKPRSNPPFFKTLVDGVESSVNSFVVPADSSIPAGAGYHVELVQRMNASDNIMVTSAAFSIATAGGSNSRVIFPGILAVPAAIVVLIIAGSAWCCWFRKRRRQSHRQAPSPSLVTARSSPGLFDHRSQANSTSPLHEAKTDGEDGRAEKSLQKRQSMHGPTEPARDTSLPTALQFPPPPPDPPAALEMPVAVTPRSSRRGFGSLRRPKVTAELDTRPPSHRPHSVDATGLGTVITHSPPPNRHSTRLSPQQITSPTTLGEPEGHRNIPFHFLASSTNGAHLSITRNVKSDTDHPIRSPKRSSLRSSRSLKRIAELEGCAAIPAPAMSPDSATTDEESQMPLARRSRPSSLLRLLRPRTIAELEANDDVLPEYSRAVRYGKRLEWAPPLPAKDISLKEALAAQHPLRRAMTPIELDASQPEYLPSPPIGRASPTRYRDDSIAAGAASSSASSSTPMMARPDVPEGDDEAHGHGSELVPMILARSLAGSHHGMPKPERPEMVDFLDLTLTKSEEDQSGVLETAVDITDTWSGKFGPPVASPQPRAARQDVSMNSEVISATLDTSGRAAFPTETEDAGASVHRAEPGLGMIHELDATELAHKRRSKRLGSHFSKMRHEVARRRPDFTTFKKQMSEAERRAKMIAKRRGSRRRRFKSF